MPNRYTYTGYWGGGRGLAFRGSSPAWPYVGRGRGGLPRCMSPSVQGGWSYWQQGWATPAAAPATYGPQMSREQEIESLKSEQQFIKNRLEQIDARLQEMEKQEDN